MTRKRIVLISWIVIVVASTMATSIIFLSPFGESKSIIATIILFGAGASVAIFWILTDYKPKFIDWIEEKLKIKAP